MNSTPQPPPPDHDEMAALGLAVYLAQRIEFALYGLVSHLSHLPEAKKESRFRALNPEAFLRGDPTELKATLGQLGKLFADPLMLDTKSLAAFVEDRNLIAHNFYRVFHLNVRGAARRNEPKQFLLRFIEKAQQWQQILTGLLCHMMIVAAKKENREADLILPEGAPEAMSAYEKHAAQFVVSAKISGA